MIKFLLKERVDGVQAAARSPTRLKVLPSVMETSSPSTEQVTQTQCDYTTHIKCFLWSGNLLFRIGYVL